VGIGEVGNIMIWPVSFAEFDLAGFDAKESTVEPAVSPFLPKVLPMSPV
jgi:hypothetical protein